MELVKGAKGKYLLQWFSPSLHLSPGRGHAAGMRTSASFVSIGILQGLVLIVTLPQGNAVLPEGTESLSSPTHASLYDCRLNWTSQRVRTLPCLFLAFRRRESPQSPLCFLSTPEHLQLIGPFGELCCSSQVC